MGHFGDPEGTLWRGFGTHLGWPLTTWASSEALAVLAGGVRRAALGLGFPILGAGGGCVFRAALGAEVAVMKAG